MFARARLGGLILGLAILLAPAASAKAAEPAKGAEPVLDLPHLEEMALKYSPVVKASRSEVKFAKEQKNEAHAYRWPQLDTTATGGVVPNAKLGEILTVPGRIFYPDPIDKIHGVNIFGHLDFSVIQPLYTFGKIAFREEAAAHNVKVKEEAVAAPTGGDRRPGLPGLLWPDPGGSGQRGGEGGPLLPERYPPARRPAPRP